MNNKFNIIPEIFASILAISAGLIIYISRIGYDNYGILILKSILTVMYIIFTPFVLKTYFKSISNEKWYLSKTIILIICMILSVLMGALNTLVSVDISNYLSVFGIFIIILVFNKMSSCNYGRIRIGMYVLFFLFGIWCVSAYSLSGIFHPLFIEKLTTGAYLHRDAVWFPTLAGMSKVYGISSNGLDGLLPVHYHIFSHYLFGEFSNLLNVSTFIFYNICVPIIFTPILFLSLIFCIKEIREYYKNKLTFINVDETNNIYWFVLSALFIMPFPLQLIGIIGGETYQYLTSGSYKTAFIITFLLISIIFEYLNKFNINNNKSKSSTVLLIMISIILFYIIALSKVSFLFVVGLMYGYIYLRYKYYNNTYHNFAMFGFISVTVIIYISILNTETFLKNSYQIKSHSVVLSEYILYIAPSIIYSILKIYSLGIKSISDFVIKLKNKELIEVEILFVLAVVIFPLPFQYFKGIQIFIAYILILAHLGMFLKKIGKY